MKSFYSNTEFTCFSAIAVIYHRRNEHELRDKNGLKSERAEFAISVIRVEPCAHSSKYVSELDLLTFWNSYWVCWSMSKGFLVLSVWSV